MLHGELQGDVHGPAEVTDVQPAQRFLSQQMTVDWFGFWLKGFEEPDPEKTAQYRRWRELRRLRDEGRSSASIVLNN